MLKGKKYTFLLIVVFLTFQAVSQQFNGKVFYKALLYEKDTIKKIDADKDVIIEAQNRLDAWVAGADYFDLQLEFDETSSYYANRNEPMGLDRGEQLDFRMSKLIYGVMSAYYYSRSTAVLIEENTRMGETFFVKKTANSKNWTYSAETNKIGNYTCYKAERVIVFTTRKGEQVNQKQTVWYTPEIPVPYGPGEFTGFPGLVLKVLDKNGYLEYVVDAIILNPKKSIKVKSVPDKKLITEEEFNRKSEAYNVNTRKMLGN